MKKKTTLRIALGIVLIVAIYGLINIMSITDSDTSAMIKTDIPMLTTSNIGASSNGGLIITAPNTPGHWESEYGYFSPNKEVKFCPVAKIGIDKFTFIPNDPSLSASSVYSVYFVWKALMTEIVLALILIALIVALYISTKTSPASQEKNKPSTT